MPLPAVPDRPPVLVLACRGASEGALSVVRTLGRRGVPVAVLSDDVDSVVGASRYCKKFVCLPDYTRRPDVALRFLREFAHEHASQPVLFPTADPDLALVSALRSDLETHYRLFLPVPEVIADLVDKRRFHELARQHGFPVPATWTPSDRRDVEQLEAEYPLVVKPADPVAWACDSRSRAAEKAWIVDSRNQLLEIWDRLAPAAGEVIIQEYISGGDDAHYSLHVYMNAASEPLACFTGQKVRLYPAYAGSGCFVRSRVVKSMIAAGIRMLQSIGYAGVAVLNFKQDSRTGEYRLHEINARVSQWNILATCCGVDIPWVAYADAVGLEPPESRAQLEHLQYVDLRNDVKSFLVYRRNGDWTLFGWLWSLMQRRTVHQTLALDDLKPLWVRCSRSFASLRWRRRHEALDTDRGRWGGRFQELFRKQTAPVPAAATFEESVEQPATSEEPATIKVEP